MKCIPKFAQAAQAKDMRPIALQNAAMKWLSTVIWLQMQNVFPQIVPPSQKGFMRGRQMLEHMLTARMKWQSRAEIFPNFDFERLTIVVWILFSADDTLICLLDMLTCCGRSQEADLWSLLYVFNIFGYFSGLRVNYEKTFAVVKSSRRAPQPQSVAGIAFKLWVKYLGVLLGNVDTQQAYGPAIAKMMARAETLSILPLGMEEKAYLFAVWVARDVGF